MLAALAASEVTCGILSSVLVAAQLMGLGVLAACLASPPHTSSTSCLSTTVGLDPSIWNNSRGTFLGNALGQTFFARDTVISRITVWRPPNDIDAVGTHLFVTDVDTTQAPPRPNTGAILLDGPIVFVRDSDPPGQLIEMSFVIDPPLALPRRGTYAFFIQRASCDGGETIIIGNDANPYPDGMYWLTPRTFGGPCHLRPVHGGEEDLDLIFEIEFCNGAPTPASRRSWGTLKTRYR